MWEISWGISGTTLHAYSLEANHLIWVWIMKVKGPKNQADFITHSIIGPRNAQIFSLNNAEILIWPPD